MSGIVGLLKHAPSVPQCALAIEEILKRAGFPEGAFQALFVTNEKAETIINDPRIAAVTLTGSERAGIEVGVTAAKEVKNVVLELGGSDPFIIMPSANLDIVAEPIADRFQHAFVKQIEMLKVGDPMDSATNLGPLASAQAVTSLDELVQASIRAATQLLTGGHPICRPGLYYAPTVLANIPKDCPAYNEDFSGQLHRYSGLGILARQSRWRMILASDLVPALGLLSPRSKTGSWTKLKRAWFSSTGSWLPIHAYHSAGLSPPVMDVNSVFGVLESSQISKQFGRISRARKMAAGACDRKQLALAFDGGRRPAFGSGLLNLRFSPATWWRRDRHSRPGVAFEARDPSSKHLRRPQ